MEKVRKEGFGKKEMHGTGKKPYTKPRLTLHGDVKKITEVLRLACAKKGGAAPSEPISDRNAKENFAPVDGRDILARLATIPIETWNYKAEDPTIRHIGPMAQDFSKAFGVGEDDKRIHMIDASGVALASIQALHKMVLEREEELRLLKQQVRELRSELVELKRELIPLGG
jgi:hypothetical protein